LAVGDVRAQEQDSDGARKERGHRVQDDVELHTRHVVERLRDAVADRRVRQSANAARPNAQPLRAIGKHPQAADEHLRDAGGQGEEEGLRGRASVVHVDDRADGILGRPHGLLKSRHETSKLNFVRQLHDCGSVTLAE
jgi:hypothetical protein